MEHQYPFKAARDLASSHLLVSCAALAALFAFVPTGQHIVAAAVSGSFSEGIDRRSAVAFLLNVAIVLFALRRSKDLRKALAESEIAQRSAHDSAYLDHVTGLANRRELMRLLAEASAVDGRSKLLLLDLDFFKKVNDLYGHVVGDQVLRRTADILSELAPKGTCCARLGGDEFALLIPDYPDEATSEVISQIIAGISEPIVLGTATAHVSASVGISHVEVGMTAEECLRRSDIAMYAAKRAGRNRQVWFDKEMELELIERTRLEEEIRDAIAAGEFVPYYQPQMDLASGHLTGFEVLARWHSPTRGFLEPADFMSIAEGSGLISALSFSVMRQALHEAKHWPAHLKIAVNISPVQFRDSQLAERILKLLAETNFPGSRLEVEITESSFLEDRETALTIVESLKNMGVTISLDDFGTGYASLSQLQSLPFDRIKIDKSFVSSLLADAQSDAIVSTILSLGRALQLPITAEGIEDDGTADRLKRLGCSDGQGWLFGKAVSGEVISATFGVDPVPDEKLGPEIPSATANERRNQHRRAVGTRRGR